MFDKGRGLYKVILIFVGRLCFLIGFERIVFLVVGRDCHVSCNRPEPVFRYILANNIVRQR